MAARTTSALRRAEVTGKSLDDSRAGEDLDEVVRAPAEALGELFHRGGRGGRDPPGAQASEALLEKDVELLADLALLFRESALKKPASGTLQNLVLSEWQQGQTGAAVLAWEQALCLDPFNRAARENLRFARKVAQLEGTELAWYEVVSSWLPVNWWAWVAGLSFWGAVAAGFLPGIMRLRKAVWQQALAAPGLAIFLLSVPAHLGVESRSRIGFVLQKDAPLRLTPTEHAQFIARLGAGEPARLERIRGRFLLIRTNRGQGCILAKNRLVCKYFY